MIAGALTRAISKGVREATKDLLGEAIDTAPTKNIEDQMSSLKITPEVKEEVDLGSPSVETQMDEVIPSDKQKPKSALRKILDNLPEDKKVDIPEDQPKGGVFGFHGTARERAADEDFFDIWFGNPKDEFLGQGFYFTINPTRAGEYANIRAIKDLGKILTKNEEWELGLNPLGQGSRREGTHYRAVSDPNRILTVESVLKGLDVKGKPMGSGQQIVKVDLSDIEKPFVVKTNKQRLKAKENIEELKEQGYDSIIFDDLTDRSQQILVFPEHINKVKSTLASLSGRSPVGKQKGGVVDMRDGGFVR